MHRFSPQSQPEAGPPLAEPALPTELPGNENSKIKDQNSKGRRFVLDIMLHSPGFALRVRLVSLARQGAKLIMADSVTGKSLLKN